MSLYNVLRAELAKYDIGAFSPVEQQRRINICQSCSNYSGDEEHKCGICKCSINWFVLLTKNSCPEGKWVGKH